MSHSPLLPLRGLCLAFLAGAAPAAPLPAPRPALVQGGAAELPSDLRKKAVAACFEVVVPRREESGVTYARELPWDLVPFHIRNDKYASIGTAFAVSATELVTAHHVLDLQEDSRCVRQYFIRDGQGQVYELDRIVASDQHRDLVRFTVKDRTFSQWLELKPGFEVDQPVFTAGNAYGEGVVVRRGELIGTIPEDIKGAFSFLKSSADINPGNSGGPLLDAQGRVIGVVVRRKDNICLSMPTSELLALKKDTAAFFDRTVYGFSLFSRKSSPVDEAFELPLPQGYQALKAQAQARRRTAYTANMDQLFAAHRDEIFPQGEGSQEALNDFSTSSFPQVLVHDETSGTWGWSDMNYKGSELGRNGYLNFALAHGIAFADLTRPDHVKFADLQAKPKLVMDLFLKGLNITRTVAGQEIRITSFGEPVERVPHVDRFGRRWTRSTWIVQHTDHMILMYSTPTPQGAALVIQEAPTSLLEAWLYDLPRILDLTYVPYTGRMKDWAAFLAQRDRLPEFFKDLRLELEEGKRVTLRSPWWNLDLDGSVVELSEDSNLSINVGVAKDGDRLVPDFRRLVLDGSDSTDYFVLLKHLKPGEGLQETAHKSWKEMVRRHHPYTEKAFSEEGRTIIAGLHPAFPGGAAPEKASVLYTLYLAHSGTVPEDQMRAGMGKLVSGITPLPSAVLTAAR